MFIKYLAMTGCAYGIDLGIYTILVLLHPSINLVLASVTGKFISSIFSLIVHRFFTFKHHALQSTLMQQTWRYFLLVALNIPLSAVILTIILTIIPHPFLAKISSDICCVWFSYTLSKYKIFTEIK